MSESSRSICVDLVLTPEGVSNFRADPEALMLLQVERLKDAMLKSSALRQAIRTLGSTKLSPTQAIRFRLFFTAAIVEDGFPYSEVKT